MELFTVPERIPVEAFTDKPGGRDVIVQFDDAVPSVDLYSLEKKVSVVIAKFSFG